MEWIFYVILGLLILVVVLLIRLRLQSHTLTSSLEARRLSELAETKAKEQVIQLTSRAERAEAEIIELRRETHRLTTECATLDTQLTGLQQEITELRAQRETLSSSLVTQFRLVASEVIEERSSTFEKRSQEILAPIQKDLERFETKIREQLLEETKGRVALKESLQEQIRQLVDNSLRLGKEAESLSLALRRDSKAQGNWGEMVLERILEASGLERGREYEVQASVTTEEGKTQRPDVLVRYPNGHIVIIDSKVSLTHYIEYINAEGDEERRQYARLHLESVKRHITELSSKAYQTSVRQSADFVMMFIPNESAYALALEQDPTIWERAYRQHVLLMNSTNLIATLRMALDLWQRDKQVRNVEKILQRANAVYDKFVTFVDRIASLERAFANVSDGFLDLRKTMNAGQGNLCRQMEQLRELGLTPKKALPEAFLPEDSDLESDPEVEE